MNLPCVFFLPTKCVVSSLFHQSRGLVFRFLSVHYNQPPFILHYCCQAVLASGVVGACWTLDSSILAHFSHMRFKQFYIVYRKKRKKRADRLGLSVHTFPKQEKRN